MDSPGQRAITEGNEVIGDTLEGLTSLASELLEEVEALLPPASFNVKNGIDFYQEVERFEIELIQRALDRTGGHQTRAAYLLKIKVTTLNSKIKRYNIAHGSVAI
jgi:DNA-binding NtrC family response regulator